MTSSADLSQYAYDTPARIAVIGGGPVGLEAALYARYLGYQVKVYEAGSIGENIRQSGSVRWFTPFGMNASPLGLAAVSAQDSCWKAPASSDLLQSSEFVARYLLPLAQTDLLADSICEHSRVVSVVRGDLCKTELMSLAARREWPFRIMVEQEGRRTVDEADIVIDASGLAWAKKGWGIGGGPVVGERQLNHQLVFGLPDLLGGQRARFEGKHVLLVGSGFSAATNLLALERLARESGTRVTWVVRREGSPTSAFPISLVENDALAARRELAEQANHLAAEAATGRAPWLRFVCGMSVTELRGENAGPFSAILEGSATETVDNIDVVLANVGGAPDWEPFRELQVHLCYASEAPMALAKRLLGVHGSDCTSIPSMGPAALVTTEPDYYVLGSKSYGRNAQFLLSTGLKQIVELFTVIGGREGLDLYGKSVGRAAL